MSGGMIRAVLSFDEQMARYRELYNDEQWARFEAGLNREPLPMMPELMLEEYQAEFLAGEQARNNALTPDQARPVRGDDGIYRIDGRRIEHRRSYVNGHLAYQWIVDHEAGGLRLQLHVNHGSESSSPRAKWRTDWELQDGTTVPMRGRTDEN